MAARAALTNAVLTNQIDKVMDMSADLLGAAVTEGVVPELLAIFRDYGEPAKTVALSSLSIVYCSIDAKGLRRRFMKDLVAARPFRLIVRLLRPNGMAEELEMVMSLLRGFAEDGVYKGAVAAGVLPALVALIHLRGAQAADAADTLRQFLIAGGDDVAAKARNADALPALLALMDSSDSYEVHEAVHTLEWLVTEEDRDALLHFGAVPRLVALTKQPETSACARRVLETIRKNGNGRAQTASS